MAKSIQRVADRSEAFDDVDLLLVVRLLLSLLDHPGGKAFVEIRSTWEALLRLHAPGTIDLGLEDLVANAARRDQLSLLLDKTEDRLQQWGEAIPHSYLKRECQIDGVIFEESYPTRYLISTVRRLRGLVGLSRSEEDT